MKIVKWMKEKWEYWLAFCVCMLLMLIRCMMNGVWIFGENSLLSGDANLQFVHLMAELWEKIRSGGSLFHSWNAQMGYDFYTNACYTLISPFNILVLLLPKAMIEDALQFVIILRWALMAPAMVYYCKHTRYNTSVMQKKGISFLLGISYALCDAVVGRLNCYIWYDVLLFFPLLVLAFEKMMEEGRWKWYYVILTLSLCCNFYMSIPVCLFLVLWFFNQDFSGVREFVKKGIRFAVTSILSVLSCAVIIVPAYMQSRSRMAYATQVADGITGSDAVASFLDAIEGLYILKPLQDAYDSSPNLYMGIFWILVCGCFVFSTISIKTKVKRIITLLFISAAFFIEPLNYLWHGFAVPNGWFHRFAFIWCFLVLHIGMEAFPYLQKIRIRYIGCIILICGTVFGIAFFETTYYQEFYVYLSMILCFVFYCMMLTLYRRKSIKGKAFLILMSFCTLCELCANALYVLRPLQTYYITDERYNNRDAYELKDAIELNDGQRVAFNDAYMDIGAGVGLDSVCGFLTYSNSQLVKANIAMGANRDFHSAVNAGYCGETPLVNLMYNVGYGYGAYETAYSDVELEVAGKQCNLYKMKRNIGIGYMVKDTVRDWTIEDGNWYDVQNDFVKKATGEDAILELLPDAGECSTSYATLQKNEDGLYPYILLQSLDGIVVNYEVEKDMDLYFWMTNPYSSGIRVVNLDGETIYRDSAIERYGLVHIGNVKKGQKVEVMYGQSDKIGEEMLFNYQFVAFDEERFQKVYEKLSESTMQIEEMKDAYLRGNIDVKMSGMMMTSILAKDGYTLYVDGKETPYEAAGGTFMAVPLKEGQHQIEVRYVTPGFYIGAVISICSIALFAVCVMIEKKRTGSRKESK